MRRGTLNGPTCVFKNARNSCSLVCALASENHGSGHVLAQGRVRNGKGSRLGHRFTLR